ncbi:ATP-binding protein [Singulisphaera sp. Ch08]|uniref:ATP-binding protein n=1 Tax=Singulisphaera sp. Ch08 TaxID=3120278 RepID=A0AAU7C9V7_9BACT
MACAIGQELIRSGRKVQFATCGLMVQDLLAAKRDLKLRGFLKKISRYEVLILDDIGYVQYSREEMEVLCKLKGLCTTPRAGNSNCCQSPLLKFGKSSGFHSQERLPQL